jgi:hypothetical protein
MALILEKGRDMDKSMLDKMKMPKKPGMEDEMLSFEEEDMEMEGEAPASSMDLSSLSDDDLLAEVKKRGLMGSEEAPELDMEEAEA